MNNRTLLLSLSYRQVIAGLLLIMLAGGCSYPLANEASIHSDRSEITIMYPIYTGKVNSPELIAYIENKLNIRLQLMEVQSSSYNNRARVALTRSNGPDALVWTAFPQAELFNYARTGQLHSLDPYLDQYPNLLDIPSLIWDNSKIDNQLFGVPRPRAFVDQAVFIRKDWLEQLDRPIPVSLDDYTVIASQFATEDPDRNGIADTFGFAAFTNLGGVWDLSYAFDTGHIWKETPDGSLLHSHLTEGREHALKWLKALYSSGGLDPRYNEWNAEQMIQRFINGHTGIMVSQISNFHHVHQQLTAQNPEAKLIMLPPPIGPAGVSGFAERLGFYGQIVIPARVSTEKAESILALLDWMSSEEGEHIRRYGLEGIHHILREDSEPHVDYARLEKDGLQSFFFMNQYNPYFYVAPHAPPDIQRQQHDMLDQVKTLGIADPAAAFMSSVQYKTGGIFNSDINEYFGKYVRGEVAEQSLEQFRSDWLNKGGRLATSEVNDWYRQRLPQQ